MDVKTRNIQFWMNNKYHPILEDNKHPLSDVHKYHPILKANNHPLLDDSDYCSSTKVINFWMKCEVNKHPKMEAEHTSIFAYFVYTYKLVCIA